MWYGTKSRETLTSLFLLYPLDLNQAPTYYSILPTVMLWARDLPVIRPLIERSLRPRIPTSLAIQLATVPRYQPYLVVPYPLDITSCLRPQLRLCRPPSSEAAAVDLYRPIWCYNLVVKGSAYWIQQMAQALRCDFSFNLRS